MLQVPCLSPPPIYGHSHYKKFWLRQNSEPGPGAAASSAAAALVSSCDMKSSSTSTTTSSSPDQLPKLGAKLGKRRSQPQPQRSSSSPLKMPESSISPTSSSVDNDELEAKSGFLLDQELALLPAQLHGCSGLDPGQGKAMVEDGSDQDRAQQATTTTPPDCLTSKSKTIDLDSSRQDEDHSDSDSATSSTSQASDHDDPRCHSVKSSSFRQYLKRQTKKDESQAQAQIIVSSPKTTRQAAVAASLALSDAPVSPSSRSLGSSSPISRTCKHCGTMKTPLWRNGPLGPKSLCNACGIRLRKARRNNTTNSESPSSGQASGSGSGSNPKRKLNEGGEFSRQSSFKKSRVPVAREKRELGNIMRLLPQVKSSSSERFGKQVSTDEEEGAVLLMALSCGLVLA